VERDAAVAALGAEDEAVPREVGHEAPDARRPAEARRQLALRSTTWRVTSSDQLQGQTRIEDQGGGFRVHVEVELAAGVTLPGAPRRSHDHDRPARPAFSGPARARRQIGERPRATTTSSLPKPIRHLENQVGPVAHLKGVGDGRVAGSPVGLDEAVEVPETVVTWTWPAVTSARLKGRRRPTGRSGHGVGPGDVGSRKDVLDARSTATLPASGDGLTDAADGAMRQEQGERVVDTGVGVDSGAH